MQEVKKILDLGEYRSLKNTFGLEKYQEFREYLRFRRISGV